MRYQKRKITGLDILLGLLLLCAFLYLAYRVRVGLQYKWNWEVIPRYLFRYDPEKERWVANLIMQGFFNTIRLSIWSTVLAMLFGTVMGFCRTGKSLFKRLLGGTYVEMIRNLPPLVLVFIFYFFVSDQIMPMLGVENFVRNASQTTRDVLTFLFAPPRFFSAFLSAMISLAIFEGAYITEIVRAGIQSVEKGQWEASSALGFSWWQQMRHIILPQAIQRILPALAGQFISVIKDSSIVSVISVQELTFQGMELMSATYLTFEIWITVSVLYLILTLTCSLAVEQLEIYMQRNQS
ncbi:amino acid ABC transporter permease [Desulfonema ishimotonii]|uniref:Amino acid ABC transporter permease n=1 Tax=Desulfonema ishimotonii TaxID=45657 RepID=A0A401FW68_9BACT|nr:amino acid ABC transporter permease [Desulfonema ishimotonii]GBC61215.1 amino acid ABC transporter permease [Desulfonema ishimotonii]